jgi:hypothetical protein
VISLEEDSNVAKAEIQALETHYVHFALASGNLHRRLGYRFTPRLQVVERSGDNSFIKYDN